MRRMGSIAFLLIVLVVSLTALYGCPKKAEVSAVPEAEKPAVTAPTEEAKAAEPAPVRDEPREAAAATEDGLQPIYFDFDQAIIRDDARPAMKANAEWLKANPSAKIRIEGNCDERGTIEYNQALGQRRAQSAKKYLTDLGVSASRIMLISYGKEKPVCREGGEACWQNSRRDDFVAVE
jgi:peptidoglycan-associated lipoprotein